MIIYFESQSAFMSDQNHHLDTLKDIKQMMERSSRFISLSGLSGIAAGICALAGAWFANGIIATDKSSVVDFRHIASITEESFDFASLLNNSLFQLAMITFITALILAFIFTYLRSRKTNTPIWGTSAKRVIINVAIPMIVGGIYILKLIEAKAFGYIAPGCLIFYGLGLLNASKYTLIEVRYLGYGELLLGLINLWCTGYGIYFWALGFGVLHILYGAIMWWKYERNPSSSSG